MEIELKTNSLKEILTKCNSLGWDVNKVKIETKIIEDLTDPDNYYVKIYLKNKK
jgi:hypothetical protein